MTTSRQLRVLYLIDTLRPGGAERSLAALAPHYRELGIALDVATLVETDGLQDEIRSAGAAVFCVGAGSRLGQARRFADLVRYRHPDLVHTTLFESDVVGRVGARAARTRVVSSLVNEAYGPDHAAEPGIRASRLRAAQALDALTARATIRMHAVSEQVADVMARRLRYPRARIDVIPRGRDPEVLGRRTPERREQARTKLGVAAHVDIVLAVARHEPQKDLGTLVRAFARVRAARPHAQLYVAGREGSATSDLTRQISDLGLGASVMLLGERRDVADLLCAADVFVLPSRREGMPGSVIEAMALETPVVASDLPQVREVTDGYALLVRAGDVDGIAHAILKSTEEHDQTTRRVQRAFVRFHERFEISESARKMVAFYERCVAQV